MFAAVTGSLAGFAQTAQMRQAVLEPTLEFTRLARMAGLAGGAKEVVEEYNRDDPAGVADTLRGLRLVSNIGNHLLEKGSADIK